MAVNAHPVMKQTHSLKPVFLIAILLVKHAIRRRRKARDNRWATTGAIGGGGWVCRRGLRTGS